MFSDFYFLKFGYIQKLKLIFATSDTDTYRDRSLGPPSYGKVHCVEVSLGLYCEKKGILIKEIQSGRDWKTQNGLFKVRSCREWRLL